VPYGTMIFKLYMALEVEKVFYINLLLLKPLKNVKDISLTNSKKYFGMELAYIKRGV
jgi:hypothetical protein